MIAANALLGINQGLAWSMTVIMKVDLVGPKSRGLAVGLNEFAGYLSVGVTAFLTGYLAAQYGLRPSPIYLGVVYAVLGLGPFHPSGSRHARTCAPGVGNSPRPRRDTASGKSSRSPPFATAICSRRRKRDWSTISTTA